MDGFTYEQTAGGWHVCDICGVRVSDEAKHTAWHRGLTAALIGMQGAAGGWRIGIGFNWPQAKEASDG